MNKHFRLIPILLYKNSGLYKGINFRNHIYVGDPLNVVRIFNNKNIDEIFVVNIIASLEGGKIPVDIIERIAEECYMPFGIGGGIKTIEEIREIIRAGAEKISINTAAIENPELIKKASEAFGSQSITVAIDVKKNLFGKYFVYSKCGTQKTNLNPVEWAVKAEKFGAGEILLTSIDKDGTKTGYDLKLISEVAKAVNIPVIACGGAGKYSDLAESIKVGASAAAAGTLFVLQGPHRAVLVQYPNKEERKNIFNETL